MKFRQNQGKALRHPIGRNADPERPGVAVADFRQVVDDLHVLLKDLLRTLQKLCARMGQSELWVPLKQSDAVILLQFFYLQAERLLGDVQALRCTGYAEVFCNLDKILKTF